MLTEYISLLLIALASLSTFMGLPTIFVLIICSIALIGSSALFISDLQKTKVRLSYSWSIILSVSSLIVAAVLLLFEFDISAAAGLFLVSLFMLARTLIVFAHNSKLALEERHHAVEAMYEQTNRKLEDVRRRDIDLESAVNTVSEVLQNLPHEKMKGELEKVISRAEAIIDEVRQKEKSFERTKKELDRILKDAAPEQKRVEIEKLTQEAEKLLTELRQREVDIDSVWSQMEDTFKGMSKEQKEAHKIDFLHDYEIRQVLLSTFRIAEHEIDIISPWVSKHAVNNELITEMENALKRGVSLKIIYGIDGSSDSSMKRKSESQAIINDLSKRYKKYGSKFKARLDNTHEKLLLCDDKYFLIGSYNLLSFGGDYKDDTRKEIMMYQETKPVILSLRNKLFSF